VFNLWHLVRRDLVTADEFQEHDLIRIKSRRKIKTLIRTIMSP
jgi:hypothetical protein